MFIRLLKVQRCITYITTKEAYRGPYSLPFNFIFFKDWYTSSTTYINICSWYGCQREGVINVEVCRNARKNPRAREGDHHSISHTTPVDHVDRTQIAEERSECIINYAIWSVTFSHYWFDASLFTARLKKKTPIKWENAAHLQLVYA